MATTISSGNFTTVPLFMQSLAGEDQINYSAEEFRRLTLSVWPTSGVVTPTAFHVTQADSVGWSVRVGSGVACINGYLITNTDPVTISLASIDTNPTATRYHAVFLCVHDKVAGGDGYFANIMISVDTGAGWVVPDVTGWLLLGVIGVSPGQANVQNTNISAKPANANIGGVWLKMAGAGVLATGVDSAHTVYDTGEARVRYTAGRVNFGGGIRRTSGVGFDGEQIWNVGTVPWYMAPNADAWIVGASSAASYWRMHVTPTGLMQAHIPGASNQPSYLFLDGMSYEVD